MRNKIKFTISLGIATAVLSAGLNFAVATDTSTTTTESTDISTTIKAECMVDGMVNADCVMKVKARLNAAQKAKTVTPEKKEATKLNCPNVPTTSSSTSATASNSSTSTTTTTNVNAKLECPKPILKRLEDKKVTERQEKIKEISRVYQGQVERAQKSIDKLQKLIDRVKAQRAKLATAATIDLAAMDALIAKAQTQKQEAVTALADVKAKADAIKLTLNTVRADTVNGTDTAATNLTNIKQQVKDFQASVKVLKGKLNTLHRTLQEAVKKLKAINTALEDKEESETEEIHDHSTNTSETNSTAGGENE